MDIEQTRDQARRLENQQRWGEALENYLVVADELERRGESDPELARRLGDLYLRVDDRDGATQSWEQAVEGFLLQGLPDSALAVCRKIVRYSPEPEEIYLRMGQIRARQGLFIYARKHFLTYAEMKGQAGDVDEAIRAMEELMSWVPSDLESRLFLADRLIEDGRQEKALVYLREGYWRALLERNEEAMETLRPRVLELDPGADLRPLAEAGSGSESGAAEGPVDPSAEEKARKEEGGIWARILEGELRRRRKPDGGAEAESRPAAEAGDPVPTAGSESPEPAATSWEDQVSASTAEVLRGGRGDGPVQEEETDPEESAREGSEGVGADTASGATPATSPSVPSGETAGDAARPADPGSPVPAAPTADVADDSATTAAPAGGGERSNFARLLSQFREETASHADEREARAQYELGRTDRAEGELDGAIARFEKALSIRSDFLPAYEMLGRCHLEKGEPALAIQSLEPALEVTVPVEDDLLQVYYHLGRAHESLGQTYEAREWYERVFAIDINFLDVIERLRALR